MNQILTALDVQDQPSQSLDSQLACNLHEDPTFSLHSLAHTGSHVYLIAMIITTCAQAQIVHAFFTSCLL